MIEKFVKLVNNIGMRNLLLLILISVASPVFAGDYFNADDYDDSAIIHSISSRNESSRYNSNTGTAYSKQSENTYYNYNTGDYYYKQGNLIYSTSGKQYYQMGNIIYEQ